MFFLHCKKQTNKLSIAQRSDPAQTQRQQYGQDARVVAAAIQLKSYKRFLKIFHEKVAVNKAWKYVEMNGVRCRERAPFCNWKFSKIAHNFWVKETKNAETLAPSLNR